ncbi:hypothetical protein B0T26DRAFT_803344 [Lasiosphaeria miniovina]|uniref:Uncharacterized protein n=1 Tax=Lasiosphaeria miniovina TaxID=1954250 RepID=A0AA40AML5_9PEZI|nr:uncharacterized protein B0T26DRAFT_803344 [Lasiosphaeria miniovina]KAK0718512.1 hypothetical protein B0T26DRAFT_803344 [Lasiosphaeria miniovina]
MSKYRFSMPMPVLPGPMLQLHLAPLPCCVCPPAKTIRPRRRGARCRGVASATLEPAARLRLGLIVGDDTAQPRWIPTSANVSRTLQASLTIFYVVLCQPTPRSYRAFPTLLTDIRAFVCTIFDGYAHEKTHYSLHAAITGVPL